MITNKLQSYGAAKLAIIPSVEHQPHKGLYNRVEILINPFDDVSPP